jgi:hypothetical protein
VLISYLIRLAVEKSGGEYLSFPQRALFDKLVGDFASNLRYSTKVEISLLNFPIGSRGSDQKFSIVRQGVNEREGV